MKMSLVFCMSKKAFTQLFSHNGIFIIREYLCFWVIQKGNFDNICVGKEPVFTDKHTPSNWRGGETCVSRLY